MVLPRGREIDAWAVRAQDGDPGAADVVLRAIEGLLRAAVQRLVRRQPRYAGFFDDLLADARATAYAALGRWDRTRGLQATTFLAGSAELHIRTAARTMLGAVAVPPDASGRHASAGRRAPARLAVRGSDGEELEVHAARVEDPHDAAAADERAAGLGVLVARLPARGQVVIARRFGLGCAPQTLQEVGAALGISSERARQVEQDMLRRLRLMARAYAEVG